MGVTYGRSSILVTPAMINTVAVDTTTSSSYVTTTDINGGAIVTATFTGTGCGCNEGIYILMNDIIPWTRLYCRFIITGTCSCWGWNGNNGYGQGFTAPQAAGNLLQYNEALGDLTANEYNVWNLPQFIKYFSACDNNTTNYMHANYAIGPSRGFDMFCRRNSMGTLAGPSHGRGCMSPGTITIKHMRILIK